MNKEDAEFITDLKDQASCITHCAELYLTAKTKEDKQECLLTLYREKERFDELLIDLEDD